MKISQNMHINVFFRNCDIHLESCPGKECCELASMGECDKTKCCLANKLREHGLNCIDVPVIEGGKQTGVKLYVDDNTCCYGGTELIYAFLDRHVLMKQHSEKSL